jgi:hypothetical protein
LKFTIPTLLRSAKAASRPTLADMTMIDDPHLQRLALVELNCIIDAGVASVYVPAAADFWNVWLGREHAPTQGMRVTLEERSRQLVVRHSAGQPGGAA